MTILEQISYETMVFMRGRYRLDEIGDGKDELNFSRGKRLLLQSIFVRINLRFSLFLAKKSVKLLKCKEKIFQRTFRKSMIVPKRIMTENGCLLT